MNRKRKVEYTGRIDCVKEFFHGKIALYSFFYRAYTPFFPYPLRLSYFFLPLELKPDYYGT
jgi:hypothetical protein